MLQGVFEGWAAMTRTPNVTTTSAKQIGQGLGMYWYILLYTTYRCYKPLKTSPHLAPVQSVLLMQPNFLSCLPKYIGMLTLGGQDCGQLEHVIQAKAGAGMFMHKNFCHQT